MLWIATSATTNNAPIKKTVYSHTNYLSSLFEVARTEWSFYHESEIIYRNYRSIFFFENYIIPFNNLISIIV